MIGIVVAAHGELASALVQTARSVVPNDVRIEAVSIEIGDDTATYGERLRAAIDEVRAPGGVLVLTDMFGGTPSNIGLTMHHEGEVEVLTGASLPMLIKALQVGRQDKSLADAALAVKDAGQRAITVASEVLRGAHRGGKGS